MAASGLAVARASAGVFPSPETARQTLSRLASSRRLRAPPLPTSLSPTRLLALRLRSKNEEQRKRYARLFRHAARQKHERLPLLTLQTLLRKQIFPGEEAIAKEIGPSHSLEWRDRMRSFALRGWSEQDLDHWVWILSAVSGDWRVKRLLSTERPKPPFLLLLLLRSDERFRRGESLTSLTNYISTQYCTPKSEVLSGQNGTKGARSPEPMHVEQFIVVLRRLVHHVQRLWPQYIVAVARLTTDYIRNIPLKSKIKHLHHNRYASRCLVFNTALQLFKKPATQQPIANMEFNWRAQKILLAMSDNLDRRLIISKPSFRAIRQVMIGLKRSGEERAVAARYSKTWPPYRQDFDGLDAKRTPEGDYSRSVKAGILATQEGFPEDNYDRALDALGGTFSESPTIQTRSLPPKEWKDEKEQRNFFNLWAMKVRSTRNVNEAWRAFTGVSDVTPNFQVYGEMFLKLQAEELENEADVLPGDSRETFPVHQGSYSEYELARQSPPTVAELYDEMISRGVKPEGNCLIALVRNARTVEDGLRYLRDSHMDSASVNSIAPFKRPSHQALRRIPLLVFSSYIQLLCRLQPNRRGWHKFHPEELFRIRHAINLIKLRLTPETTEGVTFRPPWHAVFRALARPHLCLTGNRPAENDAEALAIFDSLLPSVQKAVGIDPEIFMYYCRTIQKTAVSQLDQLQKSAENPYSKQFAATAAGEHAPLVAGREDVLTSVKELFATLTQPVGQQQQNGGGSSSSSSSSALLDVPPLLHNIAPAHLHTYMRTLAFLEDADAMVDAMRWMLRNWAYVDEEAERQSSRGPALIAKTLCAFRIFAAGPGVITPEQAEELDALMGEAAKAGGWRWPEPDDLDHYVRSDLRGGTLRLQQRYHMRWFQEQQRRQQQQNQIYRESVVDDEGPRAGVV